MIGRVWNQARQTELARHGFLLFAALTLANVSNYVFHVVISRLLGPEDYGALGALLSAFIIVSVPAGALQVLVAKRISQLRATGDPSRAGGVLVAMLRGAAAIALVAGAVVAAASPLTRDFMKLRSLTPALIFAGFVALSVVTPVVRGALQGQLHFKALAAFSAGTTLLRLALGVGFVLMGWGVSGAVAASLVAEAAMIAFGIPRVANLIRHPEVVKIPLRNLLREAQMAVLAFGGFWAIVSLDTVLVRYYFPELISGIYAAAAVAARTVLFLPGAIAMVAFPRFAESAGRSVGARRTLFHSIVALTILGLGSAVFLTIFRSFVVRMLFGEAYLEGTAAIAPLAFAMALMGVTNILIYFHLASNSRSLLSLLVAIGLQALGIAIFHETIVEVAFVMLGVSGGLLVFNLIAAYAQPGDPRVQPYTEGELWEPVAKDIDISVVTPAFNPGSSFRANLGTILETLERGGLTYELIAVSDGSTDGSQKMVADLGDKGLRLIHYDVNRGKGFALRMGLAKARGKYVAFIDSDGDLHSSELTNFISLMKTYDVDLVLGSKRHPLSEVEYPPLRRLMSWTYHRLVRVLFGVKLSDTQTGLKLAKRELLAETLPRMLEKRFAFDLEMIVVAKLLGFEKFMEAPVRLDYRFTSTVSWRPTIAMIIDTLAIYYRRYILRYYHQIPGTEPGEELHSDEAVPVEVAEIH